MKKLLLAIFLSTITLHAAPGDEDMDESIGALQDCNVAAGRKIQAGISADDITLFEKGKAIANARFPEEFNDAKAQVNCKPGLVEVWSQNGFSCFSTTYPFAFADGKLKRQKPKTEDPCADSMRRAEKALEQGDALVASKEAEAILYPDHYIDPGFEESMLEVGRKQALPLYQKGDKAKAGQVAEAVSSWAQSAFERCVGKSDTGRECSVKKPNAIAAYNDLAFFIDEAGKHAEAAEMLKEVVAADPQRAVAWLNLADALWAQGSAKQKEAKDAYHKYRGVVPEAKWPARVKERG